MTILFVYLFLALGISFFCSLLESVLLSTTKLHVNLMIKEKRFGGHLLKKLKHNIDRPLAAILTLNTVANTIGAAGVGAQVLKMYGDEWVAMASSALTFSILVFSEIIPKSFGAAHWKWLAPYCAPVIQFLIWILYPVVIFLQKISGLIAKGEGGISMSREEMIAAAETGVQEGILVEKEQRIIKNLLRLNAILVKDVMTPRSVVTALQKDETVKEVTGRHSPIFFSRIPVYGKDLDDIVGMVLRFKIIEASSRDESDVTMQKILMPIHTVIEDRSVASVLDEFIKRRDHAFVVKNEDGKMTGLITLEDAIETLLGVEIVDEFDSVEDMRQFALENWENRKKSKKYKWVGNA